MANTPNQKDCSHATSNASDTEDGASTEGLLQDYFNEMLSIGDSETEFSQASEKTDVIRDGEPDASPDMASMPDEDSSSSSSSLEMSASPESIIKPMQSSSLPDLKRPFQEPESEKPAVIPSLMPKLKTTAPLQEKIKTASPPEAKLDTELNTEARVDTKTIVEPVVEDIKSEIVAPAISAEPSTKLSDEARSADGSPPGQPKAPSFRDLDFFEALLFDVRGLQLAVPLVSLGSIHKIESEFTPIVGRAEWFLGLFRANERNLQVVDTARWVMPGRGLSVVDGDYQFVIRLGNSDWGLACNSVNQSIRISKNEIKWRTESSRRPWLAGTVINKMCALLDVENMATLLDADTMQSS